MRKLPSLWGQPGRSADVMRDPFGSLQEEINRVFGQFGQNFPAGWFGSQDKFVLAPNVDVTETDGQMVITAELPGVSEDDLQVELVDDVLTVRGEKKQEKTEEDKEKKYRLVERSYGSFERSFPLPFKADPSAVSASFDQGVLKVTIAKPKNAEPSATRIPIGGAKK